MPGSTGRQGERIAAAPHLRAHGHIRWLLVLGCVACPDPSLLPHRPIWPSAPHNDLLSLVIEHVTVHGTTAVCDLTALRLSCTFGRVQHGSNYRISSLDFNGINRRRGSLYRLAVAASRGARALHVQRSPRWHRLRLRWTCGKCLLSGSDESDSLWQLPGATVRAAHATQTRSRVRAAVQDTILLVHVLTQWRALHSCTPAASP